MCSPSWTLLPPPSPYHPSGLSQCTSPKHPVLCIEPGLATHFIHDILHGHFSSIVVSKLPSKGYINLYSHQECVSLFVPLCITNRELFKSIYQKCLLFSQLFTSMVNWTSLLAQTVKNPPAMRETWVQSLGWEDRLEEDIGYPLQYSCLEIHMDREAWWATVHGVAKSQTWLRDFYQSGWLNFTYLLSIYIPYCEYSLLMYFDYFPTKIIKAKTYWVLIILVKYYFV